MEKEEQIRILQITLRADYGGGPEHLYRLTNHLAGDFDFFFAAPDDEPYFAKFSAIAGSDNIKKVPHRKFSIIALFGLWSFILHHNIRLIHSHGKGAGIYGRLLSLMTLRPCIHTFHGLHTDRYGGLKKKLYILLEKILSSLSSAVIAVSEGEAAALRQNGIAAGNKLHVIENGIEIPDLSSPSDTAKPKPFEVLTVTRFDYAKNSLLAADIMLELQKAGRLGEFMFVFAGSGEDEGKLKDLLEQSGIAEYSTFLGFVPDLRSAYMRAFCYLSTSRWEGMPLSVLEAMSYRLPVIATDVRGNNNVVEHSKTGFLYLPDSPKAAADFIIRLADNPGETRQVGMEAGNSVERRFSINTMTAKTSNLYNSIF